MFTVIRVQQDNQVVSPTNTYDIALFLYLCFWCFWKCWPAALMTGTPIPTAEREGQTLPQQVTAHVDCIWGLLTAHMSPAGKQLFLEICVGISRTGAGLCHPL